MNKLKQLLNSFWAYDGVKRVVHTAWQVGAPLLATNLYMAHSSTDVKSAFVLTGAAVLAAVKALIVSKS